MSRQVMAVSLISSCLAYKREWPSLVAAGAVDGFPGQFPRQQMYFKMVLLTDLITMRQLYLQD